MLLRLQLCFCAVVCGYQMGYFPVSLNLFNLKPLLLIPGKARIVDSVVAKFNLILVVQIFVICVVYSGY